MQLAAQVNKDVFRLAVGRGQRAAQGKEAREDQRVQRPRAIAPGRLKNDPAVVGAAGVRRKAQASRQLFSKKHVLGAADQREVGDRHKVVLNGFETEIGVDGATILRQFSGLAIARGAIEIVVPPFQACVPAPDVSICAASGLCKVELAAEGFLAKLDDTVSGFE